MRPTRKRLAVVDTNTLFQMAVAFERSPLFIAWQQDQFKLILSEELLSEFVRVSGRPHLKRYLPTSRAARFIALVHSDAVLIEPELDLAAPRCRDPRDDMVIAVAIAAHADFLVTNDGDLHEPPLVARLRDEYSLRVMWPREFLEAIRQR